MNFSIETFGKGRSLGDREFDIVDCDGDEEKLNEDEVTKDSENAERPVKSTEVRSTDFKTGFLIMLTGAVDEEEGCLRFSARTH